ncbi:Hsp33 family molecular chaperone HslO [Mycoplasma sp. HU2014]|uniref:Hsp33 family molecular chaperone HslO n=1 Tax=Mycoplasma sp. HU2014 TaxID=1664275 RepID=UPI00067C9915|nr:Hsp33 family molecular chaperone HslO [Mycoplasma sp. HU2014]KNG79430.1 molecular chaperone Hsp33 [Mycoplasma sp. HU2014]
MDIRIRATSKKYNVKISIVDITESMQEIIKLQKANVFANLVLSKFTAASTLIGIELKDNDKTFSNWTTSDGAIKTMIAEFQNNKIRSYIQNKQFDPMDYINKIDVDPVIATAGKKGFLVVSRDLGLKDPYVSNVDINFGNIDYDFTNYWTKSSQTNSFLITDCKIDDNLEIQKVVGIMIQMFPGYTKENLDSISEKLGNTNFIKQVLLKSTNYQALIKEIIEDAEILEQKEIKFECTCSTDKVFNSLKLLPKGEIEDIINKKEKISILCEFCNKKYTVDLEDIAKLLN